MTSSSWVDLLSSQNNSSKRKGTVIVTECTPTTNGKVFSRQNVKTEVDMLRHQVALLMKENKELKQMDLLSSGSDVSATTDVLHNQEQEIQMLRVHIQSLCEELKKLALNFKSPPHASALLKDLERLTQKNADLCNSLAATQLSRNMLEREVILLKRTLLEERSKLNQPGVTEASKYLRELEDKKAMLDQRQNEIDELRTLTIAQASELKDSKNSVKQLNLQIEKLRQSQLSEIDRRCSEVDALKEQLSSQLTPLQINCNTLSSQLTNAKEEKLSLIERLSGLEAERNHLDLQLSEAKEENEKLKSRLQGIARHAEKLEVENKAVHSKLIRAESLHEDLRQMRVLNSDLQDQLRTLKGKLKASLSELDSARTSSRALSQQRTESRKEVEVLRSQLDKVSEAQLQMKALLEQRASKIQYLEKALCKQNRDCSASPSMDCTNDTVLLDVSGGDYSSSLSKLHSLAQSDVLGLKQRLADSRQIGVRLEVQLAQLKTDNAKLSGSYQAMLSIRDRLSQENSRFRCSNRDLQLDKEAWFKEREVLVGKLDAVSSDSQNLTSELALLKTELQQVSCLFSSKEQHYTNTIEKLKDDQNKATAKANTFQSKLEYFCGVLDNEGALMESLVKDFEDSLLSCKHEMSDVVQDVRICGNVNSTRRCQIEMCDENVVRLQGELEALRARKTVLLCFTEQQLAGKNMSILSTTCNSTISHLDSTRVGRLKQKLRLQKKQTNFLRVKLGYCLSELRLHKQLKNACDEQLAELRSCLNNIQSQYKLCAAQLHVAEQLDANHEN